MASKTFHINKAERNEKFYQSYNLKTSTFNEWAVVVLFYVTVHYVDAVIAQEVSSLSKYPHPRVHSQRNIGVAHSPTLAKIWTEYMTLYDRSRDARYTRINFPNNFLGQLETLSFEPVRKCARLCLGLHP